VADLQRRGFMSTQNPRASSEDATMSSCCPHSRSAGRFFSFFAKRYRRRFEKKGFEKSQRQLLEGLEKAGFRDATLLEIGSGVGHLHQTLLERGAKAATGVDLAPRMLEEARRWAADRHLAERVRYVEGDFVTLGEDIPKADVTILDKVVCCYPDADAMVHRSLESTRRTYALTYPRDTWYTRFGEKLGRLLMWMLRSDFRSYVHDPKKIETWISEAGFAKRYENHTAVWLTQIYVKNA
jgi:magnesium-protoporphyrin O-methyltransferase